jgi:hypothetical protein
MEDYTRGNGCPPQPEGSSETQDQIDKALIDLLKLAKMLKEKISTQKPSSTKSDQQLPSGDSYGCSSQQQTKPMSGHIHPAGTTVRGVSKPVTAAPPKSRDIHPAERTVGGMSKPCTAAPQISRDVHPAERTDKGASKTQISSNKQRFQESPMVKKMDSHHYPCLICSKHGNHSSSLCIHNQRESIGMSTSSKGLLVYIFMQDILSLGLCILETV